jgi:sugar lactone lactonase YvrE
LFVADFYNCTIRKITSSGVVTTLAGLAGIAGSADGTGSAARFDKPTGVAVDSEGNVYVADCYNCTIRKITSSGVVTTLAGLAGNPGSADGTGSAAQFNNPEGIAVDSANNVYVADMGNSTIRKITSGGVATTLAGLAGGRGDGFVDGTGSAARFYDPIGVAVDSEGNVYVADYGNKTIRLGTPYFPPLITSQPGSVEMLAWNPATFTVAAYSYTTSTFQWYVSMDNEKTWTPLSNGTSYSGVTSATLTVNNPTPAMSSYMVECVVRNAFGSTTSNPALLGCYAFLMYGINGGVQMITPGGKVSPFAPGLGYHTGCGGGLAVDGSGNVYVVDGNGIAKITPAGVVSTFVSGIPFPQALAVDGIGNVYAASTFVNAMEESIGTVLKITPAGVVSTFATDFGEITGLAFDGSGNLCVADYDGMGIAKVTPAGVVFGYAFCPNLMGLAIDGSGNLYAADTPDGWIYKVTPAGTESVFAQGLFAAEGLACDGSGNLYVAQGGMVSKITPEGVVAPFGSDLAFCQIAIFNASAVPSAPTITAQPASQYAAVGETVTLTVAAAGSPTPTYQWQESTDGGKTWDNLSDGNGLSGAETATLVVGDTTAAMSGWQFRSLATNALGSATSITSTFIVESRYAITTLAGLAGSPGCIDGTGSAAFFYDPTGVAVDSEGNVYVADSSNSTIRKITSGGVVTTLAGSAALFWEPEGVAVDRAGNVYVADSNNATIRKITSGGVVTTLAGLAGNHGSADGTGSAARFDNPSGVAVDSEGNLYVADYYNCTIRKVTSGGVVTTLAGLAGNAGSADGTGSAARFDNPSGVAVDSAGNVYVADCTTIRKVTSGGVVTTLAGLAGNAGSADGTGSGARFDFPNGVAVDSAGNVYVADTYNCTIRKITGGGVVTTPAGLAGGPGSADGLGSVARFHEPTGIAVGSAGNVVIADRNNYTIRLGVPLALVPLSITIKPVSPTLVAGGTVTLTATASGNPTPTYQWQVLSAESGSNWTDLTDTALYSGTATGKLTITGATGLMNDYRYRCMATNIADTVPSNVVALTVNKAVSVITWAVPAAITYPTPLSGAQLDATANVPGVFVYSPAAGTVLTANIRTLTVKFTPTDTTDYTTATATQKLTVNKAVPVITWAAPAAITYGTPLSATQLDATANVPGAFVYTPAAGKVLTAGTQTLSVKFTPTDTTDYATVTPTQKLTVNKAAPVITWPAPAAITYPTPLSGAQLDATANVPGAFVYTPAAGTVLTANIRTLSVRFTPTDATDYTTATATQKLTVNKAIPVITWATPAAITYPTALSGAQLDATANVPGAFVYTPAAGKVLTAGTQTLSVKFTPTDTTDYAITTATQRLLVLQVVPVITWATPAAITYPTPLSGAQLDATANVPGAFVYTPAAGTVLTANIRTLNVRFTPTDTTDYTTATATQKLTVNKAIPVITWAAPAAITYPTPLSSAQLDATANVPGAFVYTPAAGKVLTAGTQTLSVKFTPTDTTDYSTANAAQSLTVN